MRARPFVLCLLAVLWLAPGARAAITASAITSPANGSELFFNGDNGTGAMTVAGTVTHASSRAKGDIVCYTVGNTKATKVVSGVDVSSGSFAINVSLAPIAGFACRLAMIPAGSNVSGTDADAFTGPAISVSDQFSHSAAGSLYGYYILSGTLPWSFAFQSLGDCPVASSYATDLATLGSFSLFAGNACLLATSGVGAAAGTRSAVQVDGLNAYAPAAISSLANRPGFQPITYGAVYDAAHDTVVISEADNLTICNPPATFPPTVTTCPSLHNSGVLLQQTTRLLPGGQVARVTQRFSSIDQRSHTFDALFSQSVTAPSSGRSPGFQFPGQSSFATHSQPDSFTAFPAAPSSIAVISDASGFLPATSNPIGTITYSRPPVSADFVTSRGSQVATFLMHYADTIPAGGLVTYDWSFAQASSVSSLISLEAVERDRFAEPTVVISSPRNRATVRTPTVRVRGRVEDSVAVVSLTVAGRGVAAGPGGLFSAGVPLKRGKNRIVATARNAAGNAATTSIVVTYKPAPCKVPRLRGMTLSGARSVLTRNGCAAGTVRRVRSRTVRKGHVISSSPPAGSTRKYGTKVALVLSAGR